ncbi:MAG TPA: zinc ribbon domain-containing protein [Gemmatimonadales bacterium]
MGVLRQSGSTKLSLRAVTPDQAVDPLLVAVREAAADEYAVLGEVGRAPTGAVAYLARDVATKKLVVLRLTISAGNEYLLEVVNQLDTSVPAPPTACPRCRAPVRGWGKFCTQCGLNLWGEQGGASHRSKEDLLVAVQDVTRGNFEILGEMSHAGGKGVVYFARDLSTGKIEALRLQPEGGGYSIGLTGVLQRYAGPIANYKPPRGGGKT